MPTERCYARRGFRGCGVVALRLQFEQVAERDRRERIAHLEACQELEVSDDARGG